MRSAPLPELTPLTTPYWTALQEGRLTYQKCEFCSHTWLPAREECPTCLSDSVCWVDASGRGKLISWVVYHRPVHEYFGDKVPYTVAIVELEEGPRLMTNLVDGGLPAIEAPVRFRPATVEGMGITSFELTEGSIPGL